MSDVACGRCGSRANSDATFCWSCGARLRPTATVVAPAAAPVAAPQAAPVLAPRAAPDPTIGFQLPWERPPGQRATAWLGVVGVGIAALVAVAVVSFLLRHRPDEPCAGATCGEPWTGPPIGVAVPYTSETFRYELDAAGRCTRMTLTSQAADGIHLTFRWVESPITDWPVHVYGETAAGRSAADILSSVAAAEYGGATKVYDIPQAEIGYQPGQGAVYDLTVSAGTATSVHARGIVMVAVKDDLAIVLTSLGPWEGVRRGHPNPASTPTPICFSSILTSVRWPGEPPP